MTQNCLTFTRILGRELLHENTYVLPHFCSTSSKQCLLSLLSTHYVVFDSFFWWKKCASMWCLSALWVGWWTFGSCLVIFGLISFWPTLGIFGENPIQLEHSQMISILFRAILLVFHSPYNLPPCVIWRAIKKLYYKIMHLQMTSFFGTNFISFWERHFLFKMVRKMSSFRQ